MINYKDILYVAVALIGFVVSALKIISFIKTSAETQREDNRRDHSEIFEKINTIAVNIATHTEQIDNLKVRVSDIKKDVETIKSR